MKEQHQEAIVVLIVNPGVEDRGGEMEMSAPGCILVQWTLVGHGQHMGIDLEPNISTTVIDIMIFIHIVNDNDHKMKEKEGEEGEMAETRKGKYERK